MKYTLKNRLTPSALALVAMAGFTLNASAQEAAPAEAEQAPAEAEQAPVETGPTLVPGVEVPSIELEGIEWVKGEPVTSLNEEGKVYMIECWATWCGPCIDSIPHINELHEKFADKGLVVVGMNVFEDGLDKVKTFVEQQDDEMSYRVAYSGGRESVFSKQWLDAAGVNGIPHAFFVKDGKLLFTSHPAAVNEEMITKMLAEDFDAEAFAAERKAEEERQMAIQQKIGPLLQSGDWAAVKEFAETELDAEKDKDIRNRLLSMVAVQQGDWAAIHSLAEAQESDDGREMMFGTAAFAIEESEGSEQAAKAALEVFSEEMIAEAGDIENRVMPGLVRARYLSLTGDKEGATALLKALSKDVAAAEDEQFKGQVQPIVEKAITASEAGQLGALRGLMQ